MAHGTLFVISAPSGAGKSTLIEEIRPMFPDMLYSVSCTTRAPRENEKEGVHYYFLDRLQFDNMVKAGGFLEWKEVHGNRYGTPAQPVKNALESGRFMILDIDVQGALQVFDKIDRSVGIFITVPDMDVLEKRLRQRGSDSEESIRTRLMNAPREIELGKNYRYQIINDNLDEAVAALAEVITKERRYR